MQLRVPTQFLPCSLCVNQSASGRGGGEGAIERGLYCRAPLRRFISTTALRVEAPSFTAVDVSDYLLGWIIILPGL
jgi:hypothetical protein